jgi:hypothetical protein
MYQMFQMFQKYHCWRGRPDFFPASVNRFSSGETTPHKKDLPFLKGLI